MPYKDPEVRAAYRKAYGPEHYKRNKAAYMADSLARKVRNLEYVAKLKEQPCTDCGLCYPQWVMEFDHLGDKERGVAEAARRGWSIRRLDEELAKCELVCANCHRQRTYQRFMALKE